MTQKRRIVPKAVNKNAEMSLAFYHVLQNQNKLLRKAKRVKMNKNRMTNAVKNVILTVYKNALAHQRPNASSYNIMRSVPRGKNTRGPNLKKRLFGNRNV
jgi:hypothetical protein